MTNAQKLKGLEERIKRENEEFDINAISCLLITKYFSDFQAMGIVDGDVSLSPSGLKIVNICNEFEWTPSDEEIEVYVKDLVHTDENSLIIEMMKYYRDNPNDFKNKYKEQLS